jgi:hypothetical protein
MAGLGAYGGAGLGASLAGASGMTGGAALGAGIPGDMAFNLADAGVAEAGIQSNVGAASKAIADAQPSLFDKLGAGAKNVASSSESLGSFAKQNLGNLGYAAAPILAGAMVPTTTKLGDPKDTGNIRQFAYNINPDTGRPDPLYGMRAMTPVKASEFGDKTFQGQRDLFYQQNPNPYQLGVGSLNQPPQQQQATPMATGGIVALAGGGDVVRMAKGTPPTMLTDEQLYQQTGDWNKAAALRDQQNIALSHYNATDNAAVGANINKWIQDNPFATTADINKAITGAGLTQDIVNPYLTANTDISNATRYALSHASEMPGAGGLAGLNANILKEFAKNPGMNQTSIDTLQDIYKVSDADIQRPLSHGSQVAETDLSKAANYLATNPDVQAWINSAEGKDYMQKNPTFDASDIAYTHYERYGKGEGRKWEEAAKKPIVCGPGYRLNAAGTACEPIPIIENPPPLPEPPVSVTPTGFYGNNTNPGDIKTNKDGTVTVTPNIPYRPDGGFSGSGEVKDAWVQGGGSLGYTAKVPKTAAEHNALYNKLTDDSLDAYNFLMGKGKNLTQRKAETRDRPVMARYDEAVLGKKAVPRAKTTTTTKSVVGVPGNPQSYFNEAEYLAANPDVAAELKSGKSNFTSAYEHYLMYGKKEGRKFAGDYEGYLTAAALANAAQQETAGGGEGGGPGGGGGGGGGSGPGGVGGAGGPASTSAVGAGDVGGVDAEGGYYSRGKLNYRAKNMAMGGATGYAMGGGLGSLGSYSDGGRLLKGPGDGVSDSIPATIGAKNQPARLADGEFVIPARIVSELGNGSTDAGAKKLYAMMDRVQRARGKTTGKNKVAANSRADKYLPA